MVNTGTGLDGSLGFGKETTFADPTAVPTRWVEWLDSSMSLERNTYTAKGIRSGRLVAAANRRTLTTSRTGGDFSLEVPSKGFGLFLEALFGKVATVAPTAPDTAYTQTYTLDGAAPSLVIQQNVPTTAGVIKPQTYRGCQINSGEFSCSNDGVVTAKFGVIGQSVDLAAPAGSPVYVTSDTAGLFSFLGGQVKFDGAAIGSVQDVTLTIDRKLDNSNYYLGGGGKPGKGRSKELFEISGKMTVEFADDSLIQKWLTDASLSLDIAFTGANITGGAKKETLAFSVPTIKLDGDIMPGLKGGEAVTLDVAFSGLVSGSAEPITATYITTDTAV